MSIRLKQPIGRRVLRFFGIVETGTSPSKASVEPVSRTDDPGATHNTVVAGRPEGKLS